jgi:hypothetical protein
MATGMRRHYGIPEAIGELLPGAQWVCRENDYNQIEWFSTDVEKPTLESIQAKIAELESAEPMRVVREIRDWYLSNCDWTQVTDLQAIRGPEWCAAWVAYRQQLRDLPSSGITPTFGEMDLIQGVTWPVTPELN